MQAAERLGSFGTLAARGRRPGLIDKGLRPGGNHARRRLVRSEYRLEVLTVFTAQYLEMSLLLFVARFLVPTPCIGYHLI